jgi:Co/Zn/Cd efflux system component
MKKNNDAILKLYTKPYSIFGIVSFAMAILVLGCIISSIVISALSGNTTSQELTQQRIMLIGILGWVGAMLNIAGLGIAIVSEGAKDMNQVFAHIGLLLHSVALIYHGYVIWFGFM